MTRHVTIQEMISARRPAGSKTERLWIRNYLFGLGLERDNYGNLFRKIGDSPVLWSSHTDTVHRAGGYQKIDVGADGVIRLAKGEKVSNCLGADDTAGCFLMRELILAERPGLYIFHREEEIGGLGSRFIADYDSARLAGIQFAIAFDRRGKTEVITHQAGGRCASDAFAESLGKQLDMSPSSGGIFTDTANYVDHIGECTNIGVGYQGEHTRSEQLDSHYLLGLRDRLLELDQTALVASRKPGEVDPEESWLDHYRQGGAWDQSPSRSWNQYGEEEEESDSTFGFSLSRQSDSESIYRLIRDYPAEIADWLEHLGIGADTIETAIFDRSGRVSKRKGKRKIAA